MSTCGAVKRPVMSPMVTSRSQAYSKVSLSRGKSLCENIACPRTWRPDKARWPSCKWPCESGRCINIMTNNHSKSSNNTPIRKICSTKHIRILNMWSQADFRRLEQIFKNSMHVATNNIRLFENIQSCLQCFQLLVECQEEHLSK